MKAVLTVAAIILLASFISIAPNSSGEPSIPESQSPIVTINLTQEEVDAYVEPPEVRRTYLSGTIHVQAPYVPVNHDLIVDLDYHASSDRVEWFAEGTEQLHFSRSGEYVREFYCAVDVPDSTFVEDAGTLKVTGTWTISPNGGTGGAVPDTAKIIIVPYSYPYIEAYDEIVVADPGQESEFRIGVWNWGNGPDDVTLSCIAPEGLRISDFPEVTVHLERGEVYRFTFRASSDSTGAKEAQIIAQGSHEGNYTPAKINTALAIQDDKFDVPFRQVAFARFLVISLLILVVAGIVLSYWFIKRRRSRSNPSKERRS